MPWRVSFFSQVQQSRLGGWSENFWNTSGDLTTVIAKADDLRKALFAVKGYPVQMPNIRISDVAHFREVTILDYPMLPTPSTATSADDVDYAAVAAQIKLKAPPSYVTTQWVRGIFDNDVNTQGFFFPTPAHQLKWNALFAALTSGANGWALRRLDRSTPKKFISAISIAGVVTCLAHGYSTDDYIRIARVRSPGLVNKVWRIVKVDNDSFSLVGFPLQTVSPQVANNSVAQKQVYTFIGLSDASVRRVSKHNTGRPFGQLTGRRRRART